MGILLRIVNYNLATVLASEINNLDAHAVYCSRASFHFTLLSRQGLFEGINNKINNMNARDMVLKTEVVPNGKKNTTRWITSGSMAIACKYTCEIHASRMGY